MTEHDDDDLASGIPERDDGDDRGEGADDRGTGRFSDSGRHITNRNVVPRGGASASGSFEPVHWVRPPAHDEAYDLVTPVRPQPRELFDEEVATQSRGDGDEPRAEARRQLSPSDVGFTPAEMRGPTTDQMPKLEPAVGPGPAPAVPGTSDARGTGRTPKLTPDGGFIPPESRRASSDKIVLPVDDDAKRPITRRGHVEPHRQPHPTPSPPVVPSAVPSVVLADEPSAGAAEDDAAFEQPTRDERPASRASQPGIAQPRELRPSGRVPLVSSGELEPPRRPSGRIPPVDHGAFDAPGERRPVAGRTSGERPVAGRAEPSGERPPVGRSDRSGERPPVGRPSGSLARPLSSPPGAEPSPYDQLDDRTQRRRPSSASELTTQRRQKPARWLDQLLRGATIALVLGLGAIGLALPSSVLYGGAAWLVCLVFVLSGWGTIAVKLTRTVEPDLGLRAAYGAAAYVAVAGVVIAVGIATQPVLLGLVGIGAAGFAWRELTVPIASWQRVRDAAGAVREKPALAALIAVMVALACVRIVGGIAALDRNPWDDDIAYTPLVKRLLDAGNLVEPFSFRRLGAYGGQTALEALAAARGTLANVHLVDKGLGLVIALLALVGHARVRRTQPLWLALILLTLLLLPDTAINTASYWIAAMAFVALYRAIAGEQWALAGLVAAAACTLRQNFLPPVAIFVGAALVIRLVAAARTMPVREAWQAERRGWALVAGVTIAALVPWWIAAYASSHTFLYPLVDGTWNHQLLLRPTVVTWPQELAFLVTCCLETTPLVVTPLLAVALVFTRDRRPGKPIVSLAIAAALGFVLLVHSFLGSEPFHLWRYAFGFAIPLAALLVIELGAEDDRVALPALGRWLVLAALVLQLIVGRGQLPKQAIALFDGIREAAAVDRHGDPSARVERRRYAAMQAALPEGAPVIVMLDDPAMLDFHRNAIANLDTPGFASPGSQAPAFAGAEPLRAYLVGEGYRYAAFVRSDRSRYNYRREFWLQRMFIDSELFQVASAYALDTIDSFAELATTTKVLYDTDGLVVLDLATPLRDASRRRLTGSEPERRSAWVRALADREGVHDAWSLINRADVRFEDGFSSLRFVDGSIDDPKWYELTHAAPGQTVRGTPILPMTRRDHLRVQAIAGGDMRLQLRAAIALNTMYTHPRLDISLDGELLGSALPDASGHYAFDVRVPRDRLTDGWHDLYLVFSSIADPERELHDLRIARLEALEWSPP